MPVFHQRPNISEGFHCPWDHYDMFKQITDKSSADGNLASRMAEEYTAIANGILNMGYTFSMLTRPSFNKEVLGTLVKNGIKTVEMPQKMYFRYTFIRDLWTHIPNTGTVIMAPYENKAPFAGLVTFASGGTLLCEGGKNFITEKYFFTLKLTDKKSFSNEFFLAKEFLPTAISQKAIILPNPILHSEIGEDSGWSPEFHIDRAFSVITDKKGEVHIFIDPKIHIGIDVDASATLVSTEDSIWAIKEYLASNGITNVHVPKELPVPYGLGAMQFHDGKVLLSGGQPEVAAMYREILGNDQVFETEIPITHYSAIFRSGIRCLINEY